MAHLNPNYGSELHLLRMLGRHRAYFDRKVCEVTGAREINWLEFPSGDKRIDDKGRVLWDREWQQLQFLEPSDPARTAWQRLWPQRGSGQNWDAVGRLQYGTTEEWPLVEAKANIEEIRSSCKAIDAGGRDVINEALKVTKAALGVDEDRDWLQPYYQFCNRLAALNVLNANGAPARLLYVYFCGDVGDGGRTCPQSEAEWLKALAEQDKHVGLPAEYELQSRIHKLFIDVHCSP